MRISQEPLSAAEVAHCRQMLSQHEARPLEYARGVFSATATSPTPKVPTEWLPLLLGREIPSQQALNELFDLLMRDYNSVCDCLDLGIPVVPAASDVAGIREFCQGYIRVVQKTERWKLDQEAFAQLLPIAVLSEYVQAASLSNLAPDYAANPEEWICRQREDLSNTVAGSYAYWEEARKEPPPPEPENVAPSAAGKIGRNEACPCGSGKKYKKCCGAPS